MVASTDGVEVAIHDFGGSGPNLLICHATGFLGAVYRPMARSLTDNFRVYAIDMRGHGDSYTPEGLPMAWSGMTADISAAIGHIGGPVSGFGHSMGGACLMGAESAIPGLLTAAYLYEPILFPATKDADAKLRDSPIAQGALRRRPDFDSRHTAFERYASRPPLGALEQEVLRLYVDEGFRDLDNGRVTLKCRPSVEADVFMRSQTSIFERLPKIGTRVLVASGSTQPGPATAAASQIPGSEFQLDETLGHFGPLEQPKLIGDRAVEFLSQ